MRICFACGSTGYCEHRELLLLPITEAVKLVAPESTAISTAELEAIREATAKPAISYKPISRRPAAAVEKPRIKAVGAG